MGVEILENCQRFKVYNMLLKQYLDEKNMGLLKHKVESSTDIQLKSSFHWLINKNWLRKQQDKRKRGSAIVIIIQRKAKAKTLYTSGLWFGRVVRVAERYWETRPGLVYMTCYDIRYQ